MINRKSRDEIKRMKHAGYIVALVHQKMKEVVVPGISTKELDEIAMKIIKENRAIPTFLGYSGFPACICTSINEQVVHGIPSEKAILKEGDIIAIDVGATYGGMVGDSAWSYRVGKVSPEVDKLMKTTEESLFAGIEQMRPGNVLDDISKAVEAVAVREGYGIVRQYGGHGVGHEMHEDPFLFNYSVGDNTLIKSNMAIAIEPMLNLGCDDVVVNEEDGWTVSTKDGKPSAHFEHTVIATDDGPIITTTLNQEI
ncbi:MAG TPA: type I methionyl aminopeptidase [Cyanobacteria bacterium UBA10660]|nr:MAG TPA: type I methionyl aminopeptidase [Candidatus Gastranaerophilales bacterium HUM_1]HAS93375.1 type I methionyl aminopeptidase [Cyanobacteria bacterium UBA10660]